MRLTDKPSISVETVISAPPDAVWRVISNMEALAGMGTEYQGCRWVSGRPGALGSSFVGTQRLGDSQWESTSTITALEEEKTVEWTVGSTEDPVAVWSFTQRNVPDGTEVRHSVVVGTASSGLTARIEANPEAEESIIDKRLGIFQENMVKTLEGVRRLVERR